MPSISRREFLESASFIATFGIAATPALSFSQVSEAPMCFCDSRFSRARRLAQQFGWPDATLVQADVTPVWRPALNKITQSPVAVLQGVTTESFHFCLTTLLKEHARIETSLDRVGRDLYLWSIRTTRSDTTAPRHMGV